MRTGPQAGPLRPGAASRPRPLTRRERLAVGLELAVWFGIAGLAYALTFEFADEQGTYAWGPASWPRAIAAVMALGALVHFAERVRALRSPAGRGAEDAAETPIMPGYRLSRALSVAGLFAIPLAYVGLMPYMGFYVTTPLFLAAFLFYLGERRPAYLLGVPLFVFALVNLVFTKLFFVALPAGTWPGFYDVSNWFLVTVR